MHVVHLFTLASFEMFVSSGNFKIPIVDSEARREMFLLIKLAEYKAAVVASAMPTYFTSSFANQKYVQTVQSYPYLLAI